MCFGPRRINGLTTNSAPQPSREKRQRAGTEVYSRRHRCNTPSLCVQNAAFPRRNCLPGVALGVAAGVLRKEDGVGVAAE